MLCNSIIHIFVEFFYSQSKIFSKKYVPWYLLFHDKNHRNLFFQDNDDFEFSECACSNYDSSLFADSWPVLLILSVGGGLVSLIVIGSICYYLKNKKKKKTYAFGINKKNTRYFTVSSILLNNESRTSFRLVASFYFCKT